MDPFPLRWRRWRRTASSAIITHLPAGAPLMPAPAPLPAVCHPFPLGTPQTLLVILPGIEGLPGDFLRRGLGDTTWRAGLAADLVETDLHLGYYLRGTLTERLHDDVITPARREGYRHIWLVGLALGGLAAMLYAREHGHLVDGIVLLAPPLHQTNLLRAVRSHSHTAAGIGTPWFWLGSEPAAMPCLLGFGEQDPAAPQLRLLAEFLPKGRVYVTPGGHDWKTWSRLWEIILTRLLTQPRHWA